MLFQTKNGNTIEIEEKDFVAIIAAAFEANSDNTSSGLLIAVLKNLTSTAISKFLKSGIEPAATYVPHSHFLKMGDALATEPSIPHKVLISVCMHLEQKFNEKDESVQRAQQNQINQHRFLGQSDRHDGHTRPLLENHPHEPFL